MSKRAATKARAAAKAPAKAPAVGTRAFNRRSRASRGGAGRQRPVTRQPGRAAKLLEALRRTPRVAWVCALVAFLNAATWSILTPPFQGADELDHFMYAQYLAETQQLPSSSEEEPSQEQIVAVSDLNVGEVTLNPALHTFATEAQQRKLESDLKQQLKRTGGGGGGTAASEPPLYYALEAIPYELAAGETVLDRLELMRLLSALMAAVSAFFAYLFIREALPGVPWAWTVGGLGVALAPLLAFASSAVNPDALLIAVSCALFYCLARAFRRGLTPRMALAIGAVTAVGFLTKLNFIGLAPGVILGLAILALRERGSRGRAAYLLFLLGAGVALSPVALYVMRSGLGLIPSSLSVVTGHRSVLAEASYIWQLYLPRLPLMHDDFPGIFSPLQIWFRGLIGKYNWLETTFPNWAYTVALIPAIAIAALFVRELVRCRLTLRHRAGELLTYATMSVGLLVLVGASSFQDFPAEFGQFTEPRYLLPMLGLGGAVLALAARGAGRRWGPVAGVLIFVLILAHDLFSELLVVARFYG